MFDIGWQELVIIAIVTIVVVGPKELPRVLRTVTMGIRKVRSMASDFQDSIEELARESELADIKRDLERTAEIDFEKELEESIDPTGEINKSVRELEGSFAETGEELADPAIEAPSIEAPSIKAPTIAAPDAGTTTESGTTGDAAAKPVAAAGTGVTRSGTSG